MLLFTGHFCFPLSQSGVGSFFKSSSIPLCLTQYVVVTTITHRNIFLFPCVLLSIITHLNIETDKFQNLWNTQWIIREILGMRIIQVMISQGKISILFLDID